MANDLVSMQESFSGLPMEDLIGGPLIAACNAQVKLAQAAANFIDEVGMVDDGNGNRIARTVDFSMNRPVTQQDGTITQEKVDISAPLLAILNTPSLAVKNVTVDFEMEVKSSFSEKQSSDKSASMSGSASYGFGFFKAKVKMSGSVASHKESTRTSDNRAKYTVHVEARDDGTPEGMLRLLDIMQEAIAPKQITAVDASSSASSSSSGSASKSGGTTPKK